MIELPSLYEFRVPYRSGGERRSYQTMSEQKIRQVTPSYIFEASGLDLRIQVSPKKHLIPSRTCESKREHSRFPQCDEQRHTLVLDWSRKMSSENGHPCLVSFEHGSGK